MAIPQGPLRIHDSLSREKKDFEPAKPPLVGMYVCGPTVYGEPHLGHARAAVTFDTVFRYLRHLDYKVRYVRNITDVGHLEDEEAGEGEDKIAKKARLERIEPMEVVQYYTVRYHDALRQLNAIPPSIEPQASGHMIEQIELVQRIMENGLAYEVNGSVYFDMKKYLDEGNPYGNLSGKVIEDLVAGSREDLEGQEEKRYPLDFALWKKAKPEHIMRWNSPWGEGFPGWHLECTVMSSKYLGVPFDIHGGGMDLQFPHHECEIAQSHGAFQEEPVRYWMHNNMLTIQGQKMSKSLGNFITIFELFSGEHELLEKGYHPMIVRFFMLQSHYRSTVDFSNDALKAAEKGFNRLMSAAGALEELEHPGGEGGKLDAEVEELCDRCYREMNDDFNTARTLAALFELASTIHALQNKQADIQELSKQGFERMKEVYNAFIFDILGLYPIEEKGKEDGKLDEVVNVLIEVRNDARARKDFQVADQIRDELKAVGVELHDGPDGTEYSIATDGG